MSNSRRGNKEAKKQKKVPVPLQSLPGTQPAQAAAVPAPSKKK